MRLEKPIMFGLQLCQTSFKRFEERFHRFDAFLEFYAKLRWLVNEVERILDFDELVQFV